MNTENKITKEIKEKTSFLKTISKIRQNFEFQDLPKKLSRTISFRFYPKQDQKNILDKYFEEASELKYEIIEKVYKKFKNNRLFLFSIKEKEIKYKVLFKGDDVFKELVKKYKIIKKHNGIQTGTKGEDTIGLIKSFVTNTKRINRENLKAIEDIFEKNFSENESLLLPQEKELLISYKKKLEELENIENLKSSNHELSDYEIWLSAKEATQQIQEIIKDIKIRTTNKNALKGIKIKNLPSFPLIEKYSTINEYKNRYISFNSKKLKEEVREKLENFKNQYLHFNDDKDFNKSLQEFVKKEIAKLEKKFKYYEANQIKKINFRFKFYYWVKNSNPSLQQIINSLKQRLEKLENHLLKKPFDSQGRNQYFNTLGLLAEIIHFSNTKNYNDEQTYRSQKTEINNQLTEIKSIFNRGKPIKDTFTIAGFSWTGKKKLSPQYECSLTANKKNEKIELGVILATSSSTIKYFENENDLSEELKNKIQFYYIIQTGGKTKKKNYKPKQIELKPGYLNTEKDPYALYFSLYFGKSYARRIIFHSQWGYLNLKNLKNRNRFFPANAKFKRIKQKPGDDFEYYFDVAFQYQNENQPYLSLNYLQDKIQYFIGIDRGEEVPLAYAVADKEGKLIETGLLGKELSEKLKGLQKQLKKGKRIRSKRKNLQETILHQSITKILNLLAKYPGILILENLKNFRGREKSLILKKTYQKTINFIVNALEFAGFRKFTKSFNQANIITYLVNPKHTSTDCPQCKLKFETIKKFITSLTKKQLEKNFKNEIIENGTLTFSDITIKIPNKWESWQLKNNKKYPTSYTLENLKEKLLQKNYDAALNIIKSIKPRITQEKFICLNNECDYQENADIVGAINIALRGIEKFKNLTNKRN